MLKFFQTMDSHSMRVMRQGRINEDLGHLQWHPGREKQIVIYADIMEHLTLNEMKQIVTELEKKK